MNAFDIGIDLGEWVGSECNSVSGGGSFDESRYSVMVTSKDISQWESFGAIKSEYMTIEVDAPSIDEVAFVNDICEKGEVSTAVGVSREVSLCARSCEDDLCVWVADGSGSINEVSGDTNGSVGIATSNISTICGVSDDSEVGDVIGDMSCIEEIAFYTDIESLEVGGDIVCLTDAPIVFCVSCNSEKKIWNIRVYIFIKMSTSCNQESWDSGAGVDIYQRVYFYDISWRRHHSFYPSSRTRPESSTRRWMYSWSEGKSGVEKKKRKYERAKNLHSKFHMLAWGG